MSRTAACCIVRTVDNWQNDHADPTCIPCSECLGHEDYSNIAQGSALTIFFGEGWHLILPSALSVLTSHSAEVNIGIVAACIPTLLPLYRLFRDRIITARQSSMSTIGRFKYFIFGQGPNPDASSRKAIWESGRKVELSTPPNAKWANSSSPGFIITKAEVEDVEMQRRAMETH